jgi:hemolysin activation/secretion protein
MKLKSLLFVCAAGLVLAPLPGRAAQPQADAPDQKTLDEKIEELRKAVKTPSSATSETVSSSAPAAPQPAPAVPAQVPPGQTDDFRQVPLLNGIIIVRDLKEFNPDGVPLTPGLTVTNNALLETPQFKRLVLRFLFQPLNETRMRELQREIVLYYRRHDRPLVDVLYPEQDVSNGMLQIIVIEGRLKEIKVQNWTAPLTPRAGAARNSSATPFVCSPIR